MVETVVDLDARGTMISTNSIILIVSYSSKIGTLYGLYYYIDTTVELYQ